MNLRQKAKHFKKLYEQTLPKTHLVATHIIYPKHYKVAQVIATCDMNYLKDDPQRFKIHMENRMLQELRPLIWDNLKIERDIDSDAYRYQLDIWLEN